MNSKKRLQGHCAVVTGASSGIGKEYARQLAEMGADLVIAARRVDRLESLAIEIRSNYQVSVTCISIDLGQKHSARELFEKATQGNRNITILINNAGIGNYGSFMDFSVAEHLATIQVNTVAPTELTYYFVKHMLNHGKESYITQVASIAAYQPTANFTVYSGTKGYLRYFSETLAFELRKSKIRVLCLCPGGTYTEFFEYSGQKIKSTGHATMMTPESVVHSGLNAMLKGRSVVIPGLLNKLACFFPRLLPSRVAISLAYKTMGHAVERIELKS